MVSQFVQSGNNTLISQINGFIIAIIAPTAHIVVKHYGDERVDSPACGFGLSDAEEHGF